MLKSKYKLEYEIFENQSNITNTKPQVWFAFHGVGQNTEAFKKFANQKYLKVYSFGLFYHEKNQHQVSESRATTLENWLVLMQEFLENENLYFQEINVIGFSLGVRPALQFVVNFSNLSFDTIVLISPENLAISKWYRFATQTFLGRNILKKVVSSNVFKEIIISISSFIFSKSAQKLIRYQIYIGVNSLAFAWLAYRSFEVNSKEWKEISERNKGKITIVASKKDAFVSFNKIQKFVKRNSFDKGKSIQWVISKSSHASMLREFRLEELK